ncbi:MAG TPA: hypothetical protein PKD26_12355 [Pyrinomonadaceae bacterium]|nr:hypothetical protein [Pyrinomonadaceae bacterium]
MKGALNGVLALGSFILAALSFWQYRGSAATMWLIGIILFLILTLVFGGMFLSGRVNKTEEIHITE